MATYTEYNQQLLNALFKFCQEQATGTFLVATETHTCQIVIDQGLIISASYGQHKGLAALQALKDLNAGHFKFSNNYKLKMKANAAIENSNDALEFLGFTQYLEALTPPPPPVITIRKVKKPTPVEIVKPEPEAKPERKIISMYRGQPVYEKLEQTGNKPDINPKDLVQSKEDKPKKPQRMYRGQAIN